MTKEKILEMKKPNRTIPNTTQLNTKKTRKKIREETREERIPKIKT
jgi:hypothetical protein